MEDNVSTSRRRFLIGIGSTMATMVLASCSSTAAVVPTTTPAASSSGSAATSTVNKPPTSVPSAAVNAGGAQVSLHAMYHANTPQDSQILKSCFNAFTKKNPSISVQYDEWPLNAQKILTMMAAGTPPDAFETHPASFMAFVGPGQLTDLTDRTKADKTLNVEDIYPAQMEFWSDKGKVYGIPYYSGPSVVFVNKTMISKAGLKSPSDNWKTETWTWETLRELAAKLSGGSGSSRTWGWDQGGHGTGLQWFWDVPIWDNGGTMINDAGTEWGLNQQPALDVLQLHADMNLKDKAIPTQAEQQSMPQGGAFLTSRLGLSYGGRFNAVVYTNLPFEVGLAPTPKGKSAWINRDGPNGTGVPKGVKNPDASYLLGTFMGSVEGQRIWMGGHRSIPIRKSVLESGDFKKTLLPWEDIDVYLNAAKTAKVFRLPPKGAEMQRIFDTEWDKVLLGQQTVKQAMDTAVPQMNQLLKSGGGDH